MKEDLEKALISVNAQSEYISKLIIVAPTSLNDKIDGFVKDKMIVDYTVVKNDGKTDFCSQINLAAQVCDTEYFSILEFDDQYSEIMFKNVEEYISVYPDASVFLPMIAQVNPHGQFVGFMNDSAWSRGVNQVDGKLGQVPYDLVKVFPNFITSGGVFKTQDFLNIGMFKTKIKLTFMYEFLLRATYNDNTIIVIPKLGYMHKVGRNDSLFETYRLSLNESEVSKWYDTAKKEYYFTTDRDINLV